MITNCDAFLELLRCGLWQRSAAICHLPTPIDWEGIWHDSTNQTVAGVVAEAIPFLPESLHPNPSLYNQFRCLSVLNAKMHVRMNEVLSEVYSRLQQTGITALLLKGQGQAANYPKSDMRQCGDIDLYIPLAHQDKIAAVVQQWEGVSDFVFSDKHLSISYQGIQIELHYRVDQLYTSRNDKLLQEWQRAELEHGRHRAMQVNGVTILLPSVEFDSFYILHHLWNHFISTGIGLRHVCDWALYMHHFSSQLDKEALRRHLEDFAFFPIWNLFASLSVRYLGFSWSDFPLAEEVSAEKVDDLLEIVMMEGNFGRRRPRPHGYVMGKLNMFWRVTTMLGRIVKFYPREVVLYYFHFLRIGVKWFFKGLNSKK